MRTYWSSGPSARPLDKAKSSAVMTENHFMIHRVAQQTRVWQSFRRQILWIRRFRALPAHCLVGRSRAITDAPLIAPDCPLSGESTRDISTVDPLLQLSRVCQGFVG